MKFATLNDGTRDGSLLVVSRDLSRAASASDIAATLQSALDNWETAQARLQSLSDAVNDGSAEGLFDVDLSQLMAPLPRAYQWIDGSAFLNHVRLVRKARGAEMPESFLTDPLVYQGGSDTFLAAHADIVHKTTDWGVDFEAELAVVTGDVPYHTKTADAGKYVRLVMLLNDVSLRNLIPAELKKSFGFFNSKPPTAFAPFAVTPDELGDSWQAGKLHLPLNVEWNGEWFGHANGGSEMQFSFHQLIEHVSKTRPLGAGCIIGSGTISNEDRSMGSCCIAEKRMIEKIETGEFITPFMQFGDTVRIEVTGTDGKSIFGVIQQKLVEWEG